MLKRLKIFRKKLRTQLCEKEVSTNILVAHLELPADCPTLLSLARRPLSKLDSSAGLSRNQYPLLHSQYRTKMLDVQIKLHLLNGKKKSNCWYLPRLFLARPLPVSMRATSKAQVQSHCMVNPPPPVTDHNPHQSPQLDTDTNTRTTHNCWVFYTKISIGLHKQRPIRICFSQAHWRILTRISVKSHEIVIKDDLCIL